MFVFGKSEYCIISYGVQINWRSHLNRSSILGRFVSLGVDLFPVTIKYRKFRNWNSHKQLLILHIHGNIFICLFKTYRQNYGFEKLNRTFCLFVLCNKHKHVWYVPLALETPVIAGWEWHAVKITGKWQGIRPHVFEEQPISNFVILKTNWFYYTIRCVCWTKKNTFECCLSERLKLLLLCIIKINLSLLYPLHVCFIKSR